MDLERRSAGEKLAASLEGTKLAFERRASEKDVLFGSVSVADIHRELQERGFDFDRRRILLEHPIKELGAVNVEIQIHREITVNIPVTVVRPGEDPDAIAPQFVAEGRLEVPDEELAAEAENATEVVEETEVETEASEAEDLPETGTVAE